eukprot:GILI01026527.1.p1 GENE.GILI01026527.1~~GILI01026527.1.p1  ORF type:complete len:346 (-),score=32.98 GILI01026527.1:34-1071(-)
MTVAMSISLKDSQFDMQPHIKHVVHAHAGETFLGMVTTPDNKWAAACSSLGQVYFTMNPALSSSAGSTFVFNPSGLSTEAATTCISFHPKQPNADTYMTLSASSSGVVRQSQVDGGSQDSHHRIHREVAIALEPNNEVLSCSYDVSGSVFVTGGSDCKLRLYDTETNSAISTIQKSIGSHGQDTAGHNSRIFSIRFRDEFTFFSAGWGGSMFLQDTRTRSPAQIYEGVHMSGDAIAIQGTQVIAGSDRGTAQLQSFDISSGKQVLSVTTPMNVFSCKSVPQSQLVWVAGSQPSGLSVIDMTTGCSPSCNSVELQSTEGALFGLGIFDNTSSFYTCGSRGTYLLSF